MTPRSKIDRLPYALREQICLRMRDGWTAKKLTAWLNPLPEVQGILAEFFDGEMINDQNITNFRQGGYAKWCERMERADRTRALAKVATDYAAAGGGLNEGTAAIAAGKLLELMEAVDAEDMSPQDLLPLVDSLTKLRAGDLAARRVDADKEKIRQKDEEIAMLREKMQRESCAMFIKWAQDQRALEIANSPTDESERIERLGRQMYGDLWK